MFALIRHYIRVYEFLVVKKYRKCVHIKRLYTQWKAVSWLNKWKRGAAAAVELWYMTMELCERFYLFAGTHPTYPGTSTYNIKAYFASELCFRNSMPHSDIPLIMGYLCRHRYLYSAYYPYQCERDCVCARV